MLLPLRVDRPLRRPTRVTHALVALNLLVFAAQLLIQEPGATGQPGASYGLMEALVLAKGRSGPWAYLTYAFLHAGVWHILGNMLILFVFGPAVEDRMGRLRFALLYIASALVAGLAHTLASSSGVVGASGAIAGVTGAFLALFPRARVQSLWVFGLITTTLVPAWFFIGLAVARDLLQIGFVGRGDVANEAHLGGYAFGFAVSMAMLALRLIAREPYDLFSEARRANRRRDIRASARIQQSAQRRLAARGPDADPGPVAEARYAVTTALAQGHTDLALRAYADLVERFAADQPFAATLNRRAQLEIAGALYRQGDYPLAEQALARFVDAYPDDREAPASRVLLARIKARHTGQLPAAAALLRAAIPMLTDTATRLAAEAELRDIESAGPFPQPGGALGPA